MNTAMNYQVICVWPNGDWCYQDIVGQIETNTLSDCYELVRFPWEATYEDIDLAVASVKNPTTTNNITIY